jgi:hypothetical protein
LLTWDCRFHLFSIDDVEDLLGRFGRQRFKNNEILFRALDVDDIDDLVIVSNLEWKIYSAKFAVKLLEFDDNLLAMGFARTLGL